MIPSDALIHDQSDFEHTQQDLERRPLLQKEARPCSYQIQISQTDALINERDEGIRSLEYSFFQVNDIYRDLGSIIGTQQHLIDNIEANVEHTAALSKQARDHIASASRRQARSQPWLCHLLLIFVVVVLLLILVLV